MQSKTRTCVLLDNTNTPFLRQKKPTLMLNKSFNYNLKEIRSFALFPQLYSIKGLKDISCSRGEVRDGLAVLEWNSDLEGCLAASRSSQGSTGTRIRVPSGEKK